MTEPAKTRDSSKPSHTTRRQTTSKPQFVVDDTGKKTAVLLSLETWKRVQMFLQNDLEQALVSEPVEEDIPPSIAKRLRAHAKGKKERMLTLEELQNEVERLRQK